MNYPLAAAKDLAVIRSLLERATYYRTISGPTALVSAVLALASTTLILTTDSSPSSFLIVWLAALAATIVFNAALILIGARKNNQPFISPAMRHALAAVSPAMLTGASLGILATLVHQSPSYAALIWIFSYGIALCATSSFAPQSIRRLGLSFIIAGCACLTALYFIPQVTTLTTVKAGAVFMGATFGLLHLIYAGCIGLRTSES
ncbi:MAG: hypothetical protein AAGD22_05290 [Verrucomicrobiota bacterium]